jgi:hypothetical protein
MPVYIAAPVRLKKDVVQDIYVRIGAVSTFGSGDQDILDQLESQGLDYELVVSASRDLPIS